MTDSEKDALTRELEEARQLLQVGVLLVGALLNGESAETELREWIDAVAKFGGGH